MRKKSLAQKIVSIFLGASWAIIAIFALVAFRLYESHGLFVSISAGVFGLFVGMIFVLFFEVMLLQIEKFTEIKKQTKLLEDIQEEINKKLPHN